MADNIEDLLNKSLEFFRQPANSILASLSNKDPFDQDFYVMKPEDIIDPKEAVHSTESLWNHIEQDVSNFKKEYERMKKDIVLDPRGVKNPL
jgi:hypothetical protein